MITTMKYRLKPTKTQVAVMYRTLDVCRETYNLSLETKVVAYENSKVHLSDADLMKMYALESVGKSIVHSKVIQNVARRVMRSFQNFYDKRARFANRYNEFHHATPHKNVATVVLWCRKTCRSECMFVPVVDSSATEMSTRGVILLTEGSDELIARYTLLKYNTAR